MPKLFISHASEDKAEFVRPLAAALKKDFEVWFDEYELKVGDSLRKKIDEGLHACDFGIVVLSKAFFRKKWTQAELDGLLALETSNQKLILPVWYRVTRAEVAGFSPMLAGLLAASGDQGVAVVVDQLKRAINTSERTREVAGPSRSHLALQSLKQRLDAEDYEREFLGSSRGVEAVGASAASMVTRMVSEIKASDRGSRAPRFHIEDAQADRLVLNAPYCVCMQTGLRDFYTNTAERARYAVKITKVDPNGRRFEEGRICWEHEWLARCIEGQPVMWADDRLTTIRFTAADIADQIVERMVAVVHGETNVSKK